MPIIGFNFTRTNIEKYKQPTKAEKITNIMKILDVVREKNGPLSIVKFIFEFQVKYGDFGDADVAGEVVYTDKSEVLDTIVKGYVDSKQIDPKVRTMIYNAIFYRSNIKILSLSECVGLPPHFQIPSIKVN